MRLKRTCLSLIPLSNRQSFNHRNRIRTGTRSPANIHYHYGSTLCDSNSRAASSLASTSSASSSSAAASSIDNKHQHNKHNYLDPSNEYLKINPPTSKAGLEPSTNRFHHPIVYHPDYSFKSWPTSHTFPMSKFYHTAQALLEKQSHMPRPLVRSEHDFYVPFDEQSIPFAWISSHTHDDDDNEDNGSKSRSGSGGPIDAEFLNSFLSDTLTYEQKRIIGFREQCSNPELIKRTLLEVSGTILTSNLAYKYGLATNVAGGTHHAHSSMGAGYTILNDLAIGSNYLCDGFLNGGSIVDVRKVLVIDCDVHQGDGTASFNLFQGSEDGDTTTTTTDTNHDNDGIYDDERSSDNNNDDRELVTLSLHCQSNYPRYKANSTYDIGLPDNIRDEEYLEILIKSVNIAIEETKPDFVFYDAGVDIYEHDVLGRLKISEDGIRKRDRFVIERCVSDGIPVAGVIGGGYDKDVKALARRHAILHEEAAYVWRKYKLWSKVS